MNRLRSVLNQALRQAEIDGLARRNAAALTDALPLGHTSSGSMTKEQAQRLLVATQKHRLGALFVVQLTMGLRSGEVARLLWEDVDFENAVPHVRRSMKNNAGKLALGAPKTRRSTRSLLMPKLAVARLRQHRLAQLRSASPPTRCGRTKALCSPRRSARRSIRRTSGAPFPSSVLTLVWMSGRRNELRHSAVSLMSAAGVPIEAIADQVGHQNTRTTQSVYQHILNPVQPHAAVVDDVLGSVATEA